MLDARFWIKKTNDTFFKAMIRISYFCYDDRFRLTNSNTGSTPQTIDRAHGGGFDGKIEDIDGAHLDALLATVTFILVHIYQIDFECFVSFSHISNPQIRKPNRWGSAGYRLSLIG